MDNPSFDWPEWAMVGLAIIAIGLMFLSGPPQDRGRKRK